MKINGVSIKSKDIKKILELDCLLLKTYIGIKSGLSEDKVAELLHVTEEKVKEQKTKLEECSLLEKAPVDDMQRILHEAGCNPDYAALLSQAQEFYKRDLKTKEIIELYNVLDFGMDTAVLLYLMAEIKQRKKFSIGYFIEVAKTWRDKKIFHMSDVKDSSEDSFTIKVITSAFLLNRPVTSAEVKFIKDWEKYNFKPEILKIACEKTIELTGKVSFPYCNKILSNWAKENVQNLEDIARLDSKHKEHRKVKSVQGKNSQNKQGEKSMSKNQFQNFPQRDIDYDQLVMDMTSESLKD